MANCLIEIHKTANLSCSVPVTRGTDLQNGSVSGQIATKALTISVGEGWKQFILPSHAHLPPKLNCPYYSLYVSCNVLWQWTQVKLRLEWIPARSHYPVILGAMCYIIPSTTTMNMMTSSHGNISALLALCVENLPVTVEFPSHRPVTRSFDVFFDLRLE